MGNTCSKILIIGGFTSTIFNGCTSRGLWLSDEERMERNRQEYEQLMIENGGDFKFYTRPLTYVPRSRDILSTEVSWRKRPKPIKPPSISWRKGGYSEWFDISIEELTDWTKYEGFNGADFLKEDQWNVINPTGIYPKAYKESKSVDWRKRMDFTRDKGGWNRCSVRQSLFNTHKYDLDPIKETMIKVTWTNQKHKDIKQDKSEIINKILGNGAKFEKPPTDGQLFYFDTDRAIGGKDGYIVDPEDAVEKYKIAVVDFGDKDIFYPISSWKHTQEENLLFEHPISEGIRNILIELDLQQPMKNCMKCYSRQSNVEGKGIIDVTGGNDCGCNKDKCDKQHIGNLYDGCVHFMGPHGSMIVHNLPHLFQIDVSRETGLDTYGYDSWKKFLALHKAWQKDQSQFTEITDWKESGKSIESFFWEHKINLKDVKKYDKTREYEIKSIEHKPDAVKIGGINFAIQLHDIIVIDAPSQVDNIRAHRKEWIETAMKPVLEVLDGSILNLFWKKFIVNEIKLFREYQKNQKSTAFAQTVDAVMQDYGEKLFYKTEDVEDMYLKLLQAFKMLKDSHQPGDKILIHTGNWGAGEFGNNRLMTIYLQILAAYHVFDQGKIKMYFHDPPLPQTCNNQQMLEKLVKEFNEIIFQDRHFAIQNYKYLKKGFERLAKQVQVNIQTFEDIQQCKDIHSKVTQ